MNITRADLAKEISKRTGKPVTQVTKTLDAYFAAIKAALAAGNDLEIRGFGSFRRSHQKARQGRDLRSGTVVTIPERQVIRFRPSKDLKDSLHGQGRPMRGPVE
jgi:DNA-binding protein HU-beta